MTRTVEDAALALTAVAGYDSRDPSRSPAGGFYPATPRRSIAGWKIAYSPNFDVFPVDPGHRVVGGAMQGLRAGRPHVEEMKVGAERALA